MKIIELVKRAILGEQPTQTFPTNHSLYQNTTIPEITVPDRQEPEPPFLNTNEKLPEPNNYIAYYSHGALYNVNPRNPSISLDEDRQIAYSAQHIISDGIQYDLENPESIKQIKIPNFKQSASMPYVTRDLSYILKMQANSEPRPWLAVPLVYKAANLMLASPINWGKKDYYQIIKHLWMIGEMKYGDYLLEELKKHVPVLGTNEQQYVFHSAFDREMSYAKENGLDVIEISSNGAVCGECAKYQARYYSISGKTKCLPKLPQFIIDNKGLHCNNSIHAVFFSPGDKISVYQYDNAGNCKTVAKDAIKYSNRPFEDNRNAYQKQRYETYSEQRAKENAAQERYFDRTYWTNIYFNHLEYYKIHNLLGDKAPKSFSGYMRMKKNNTANFQKIAALAKENGIDIS